MAQPPAKAEDTLSLAHKLQFCTIRIETIKSGVTNTGTGFFFAFDASSKTSSVPTIVTCKHLVEGANTARFFFSTVESNSVASVGKLTPVQMENFERQWIPHPDSGIDVCAIPIAPLLREAQEKAWILRYAPLDKGLLSEMENDPDLDVLQQIILVGYPIGIWDAVNNMPVSRQGITATDPNLNYNGKSEFLIDAACFPGSSGSPVFLYNEGAYTSRRGLTMGRRLKLLGILYAGPQYTAEGKLVVRDIPTALEPRAVTAIPSNLGIVIKAKTLLAFEEIFEKLANPAKK
jgi:hypothetical protein